MQRFVYTVSLVLLIGACAQQPEVFIPSGGFWEPLHDEEKGDNYISTNAREYNLTGVAHATLPENYGELDDEALALALDVAVESKLGKVASSIRRHLDQIVRDANNGLTKEHAKFFTYFRRESSEHENVTDLGDGRVQFSFKVELVGSPYLMHIVAPEDGFNRTFDLEIQESWGATTGGETITVEISGSESRDAFPRYNELFEDGYFDIAIHFGGDYNEERHDLGTAKWLVEELTKQGWENSFVSSFDDLKIDSPPFTQTLKVNDREVEVRVTIFHSDMVEPTEEEKLADAMKSSFANADVVIYAGHAGSNAGFILDYQPKFQIKAADFATLPLADKYQIYVFDGCMTYRTYVRDLMKNPAKTFDNVDILTTVNTTPFSVGYQVIWEFVYWMTLTDGEGRHFPLSWKTMLRGVNTRSFKDVHYGVHGIDADPRLNPHGGDNSQYMCRPCQSDADCGPGGNLCLGLPTGPACGVACTTDTACPQGYRCARITDDPKMFYIPKQCIPRNYQCR